MAPSASYLFEILSSLYKVSDSDPIFQVCIFKLSFFQIVYDYIRFLLLLNSHRCSFLHDMVVSHNHNVLIGGLFILSSLTLPLFPKNRIDYDNLRQDCLGYQNSSYRVEDKN